MSLSFVIAIAAASVIVSFVVLVGSIWLAARVWQVADVSWRRAALATLWLTLAGWLVLAVTYLALVNADDNQSVGLAIAKALLLLSLMFGLLVICVGRPLRTSAVKAVCVGLTAMGAQSVVGLLLALSCRERLLEAFVLPAGSMAPTLYGRHFDITCPNCGRRFAVSASHREDLPDRHDEETATCLNCNTEIPISASERVADGDRILVDKRAGVRRWDCVPFRAPSPERVTYIKRVVGLPGENVGFAGGDVFIDGLRLRKHPREQTDLWLPWHDTKFVPRERSDSTQWRPVDAKTTSTEDSSGGWTLDGLAAEPAAVEFDGEITDACDYDVQTSTRGNRRHVPMGDVRVTCGVTNFSGTGSLELVWQFGGRELRLAASSSSAEISAADERLARDQSDQFIRRGEVLEFVIRDGTAYVLCKETELAVRFLPDSFEVADQRSPHSVKPCRLQLVARQCRVEISRVRIDRDIFYVGRQEMERRIGFDSGDATDGAGRLGVDEYFMLGDNVLSSKDSRFIGPIPASDLLGVARWRYWPRARWHALD